MKNSQCYYKGLNERFDKRVAFLMLHRYVKFGDKHVGDNYIPPFFGKGLTARQQQRTAICNAVIMHADDIHWQHVIRNFPQLVKRMG